VAGCVADSVEEKDGFSFGPIKAATLLCDNSVMITKLGQNVMNWLGLNSSREKYPVEIVIFVLSFVCSILEART
jgi:hypothetical protein